MAGSPDDLNAPHYLEFTREAWARLAGSSSLPLTEAELQTLRGINDRISLEEVADVYLRLSELLNRLASARAIRPADAAQPPPAPGPFIIGMAGSVAAGKSTTARVLQALLARSLEHPRVALVTTDGFLYPNAELEARGIMNRKGFPESYDTRRLLRFVADVRAGLPASAPVYSHAGYDIVPGEELRIEAPDILIIEGLNVFQGEGSSPLPGTVTAAAAASAAASATAAATASTTPAATASAPPASATAALPAAAAASAPPAGPSVLHAHRTFVSDLFDVSIYVDASEADLETWYIARFLRLRDTAFQDPRSYFHHYADLNLEQAIATARRIWREINLVNLQQNIEPTRVRADLILEKGPQHSIQRVRIRQPMADRIIG